MDRHCSAAGRGLRYHTVMPSPPINVVFVAPFFLPATVRMIEKVSAVPGTRCALLSEDPPQRLPKHLQERIVDAERISDTFHASSLIAGARALQERFGRIDRLLGILEHMQVQLAETREALEIEGLSVEAAKNFRDKARMKEALRGAGLPCARHRLVQSLDGALEFARDSGLPVVVKPPARGGALATYRINDMQTLRELMLAHPPSAAKPTLIEEFVQGHEYTLDTISIAGRPVWHSISRYLPTPLEALEKPWIQWCILLPREVDHPRFDKARQAGFAALQTLGMTTGLSHMEWFERTDGTLALSEVAARPPGAQLASTIGHAHGIDLFAAWARLMIHGEFEPPSRPFAAGVAFLRGQGHGRVLAVRGLEQIEKELGPLIVEKKLPTPGKPHRSHYEGDGYIIVRHPETSVVERALGRLITGVRVIVG